MIITVRSIVRITVRVTFQVAVRYIIKSAVTMYYCSVQWEQLLCILAMCCGYSESVF